METFLVRLVLMILVLLVVVPAATGNGVTVRQGGFFRGLLALVVVSLLNSGLWMLVGVGTLGAALLANVLLFGLVGLCINGAAFWLTSALLPEVLQVRSFGSACWASLIMTVASMLINHWVIL
ncbi:MAG: phage holin family protein [Candidatus Obscuribacterales bacterium]|nr:phage holin family protein [Candidatus Obscuribacterales bacterium]